MEGVGSAHDNALYRAAHSHRDGAHTADRYNCVHDSAEQR